MIESLSATKIDIPPKYFPSYTYILIIYVNLCEFFVYFWYTGLVDSPWSVPKPVWTNIASK